MNFKSTKTFTERKTEADRILTKYPDQVPIICEKVAGNKDLPEMDKFKFLVPKDLTLGQFMYVIRNRMKLSPEKAIFLFVGKNVPSSSELIGSIYHNYRDADGFLYVIYSGENTFGFEK